MFNAGDVKTYGYDKIMRPIVDDLKELETTGLTINSDVYNGTVKASIAQITGDNLGVNGICGFIESFVGNYYCRHCKMHREDAWFAPVESVPLVRTEEEYEADVGNINPSETGVKASCLLNEVDNFHVVKNFAPDIMHDLLEETCALEVYLVVVS